MAILGMLMGWRKTGLMAVARTNPNLKTCVYNEEGKPPTLLFVATKKIAPGTDLHYEYGDFSKDVPDWINKT